MYIGGWAGGDNSGERPGCDNMPGVGVSLFIVQRCQEAFSGQQTRFCHDGTIAITPRVEMFGVNRGRFDAGGTRRRILSVQSRLLAGGHQSSLDTALAEILDPSVSSRRTDVKHSLPSTYGEQGGAKDYDPCQRSQGLVKTEAIDDLPQRSESDQHAQIPGAED